MTAADKSIPFPPGETPASQSGSLVFQHDVTNEKLEVNLRRSLFTDAVVISSGVVL